MFQAMSSGIHEAILVFNLLPATYADPSWIDAPAPWRERLAQLQSPGARQVLSDWLLQQNGIAGRYDFDFTHVEKALFLQDPRDLRRLAVTIGVMRHRSVLRRMITGGTLARLGQEIGTETLETGLVRLPALECLSAPDADLDCAVPQLLPQLLASGMSWLLGLLDPAWREVSMRARFKFPRSLATTPPMRLDVEARTMSVSYVKRHFMKEGTLWI
jgi:hypothetical protein